MAVDYKYKPGVDMPSWQWLSPFPSINYNGCASVWDGDRWIYWAAQVASASAASTTQLWRFDTRNNGWQYMAALTNSYSGLDLEYDSVRNVLYIIHGAGLTSWQVFNLNTTARQICGVTCNPWVVTTMTPVLPAAANLGSSLTQPGDTGLPAVIDSGVADTTGNTTTVIQSTAASASFGPGMVGLQLRVTSGAQSGQKRTITAATPPNQVTVSTALAAPLESGVTYVIEAPDGTATAGTTTTLTDTAANTPWPVNGYADWDVLILTGTGAGQRRRIASNTATALTLSAATTGNANTGPFATAPGAGSTYKIVPSADFLYYHPGNGSTALYRIDINTGATVTTWSASLATAPAAIGPGSNTFWPSTYAPGSLVAFRGAATAGVLLFNIATKTWSTLTTFPGAETFTTGAQVCNLVGKRKLLVQKEAATRTYTIDLLTGVLEPGPNMPYAAPVAYDGKRARFVKTADGVEWLYIMRAGGQEFYRVALEWMP